MCLHTLRARADAVRQTSLPRAAHPSERFFNIKFLQNFLLKKLSPYRHQYGGFFLLNNGFFPDISFANFRLLFYTFDIHIILLFKLVEEATGDIVYIKIIRINMFEIGRLYIGEIKRYVDADTAPL